MKAKITETISQTKEVDIELPYYFEDDYLPDYGDSVVYGKVDENGCTTIHLRCYYDRSSEEIEVVHHSSPIIYGGKYLKPEYKSTKEAYEAAKKKLFDLVNKV